MTRSDTKKPPIGKLDANASKDVAGFMPGAENEDDDNVAEPKSSNESDTAALPFVKIDWEAHADDAHGIRWTMGLALSRLGFDAVALGERRDLS